MDIEIGECFGEDPFCFNVPNTYSVKIESKDCSLYSIDRASFLKKFKKII
jgi:CRP-like cAMP-binding protein